MRIDPALYVDVAHGAELAGCTREHMRRLAQRADGGVGGLEIDGHWFVRRDLAAAVVVHPTKGRPGTRRKRAK